ncbi:hypothetical protein ACKWTF_007097 [Chironomus riparius]
MFLIESTFAYNLSYIIFSDNPPSATEHTNNDEIINSINQVASEQTEIIVNIVTDDKQHDEVVKAEDKSSDPDINKSEVIQENLTIPVFSEWTQQQMQEAEKKLVELTGNSTESNKDTKNETVTKHQIVKMRQKNYASPDCGAKILANNPEAQSSSSVLSDKDEYMLSPCTDRIWFVIELCDSIQAKRVELANFELFSSPLKAVSISVSNRFPTRDWTVAGHYEAKSERDVQVFELKDVTLFGKFVRVDLEYTNTEHYCPLSFFRIFGTSEIEAFEVDNEPDSRNNHHIDEEEDYIHSHNKKVESSKDNILNRAGAVVMSIVQKASEVLKSNGNGAKQHVISSKQFQDNCMSLTHDIICEVCSNDERLTLNNIITCKNSALKNLLENEVKEYLTNSLTCNSILGFDLKSDSIETNKNFIVSILPEKYIAAMCNLVASDQKALPIRIEDISEIASKLISKKDEVSLKNISGDVHCKQPTNNSDNIEKIESELLKNVNESLDSNATDTKDVKEEKVKGNNSTNEQNIFNHVERNLPFIEDSQDENVVPEQEIEVVNPSESTGQIEIKEIPTIKEEDKKMEIPKIDSSAKSSEIKSSKPVEPSQTQNSSPSSSTEVKIEQTIEIKNSKEESRSNAPESVFLRLSNRIKVLEKNMTLSTQYLEELSRKYKKQIEDLQQSYSKLQILYDNLNQSKKETDKKDVDDKQQFKEDIQEISQKTDFLEIVLIILTSLLILLIIFIIVLFKRLSILRDAFVMNECRTSSENSLVNSTEHAVNHISNEKTRTTSNNSKKKSKRVRKISAPNILSQRNGINGINKGEFAVTQTALSRTVSAPEKVTETLEIKDNLPQIEHSAALEENDEILLSAFEDLKIVDIGKDSSDDGPKKIEDYDFDSTSTASVKTEDNKNSNGSVNFVRRLSSPTTFLKLKKTTALKFKNGRSTVLNDNFKLKKAKSESPPNFKSSTSNLHIIQKSNSFEEDALKFRKNNSFKKLFKKLF